MENKLIFRDKELKGIDNYVLGISGENEQEMLVFCFEDGFVDGTCYLELEFENGKKGSIELEKENETYRLEVKNSLLRFEGTVKMQLKIVQKTAVWKSMTFEMHVLEAINAVETIEEQYPNWVDGMTIRVSELEEGMRQIDKRVDDFQEIDPTVPSHVKRITREDIEGWNNKSEFSGNYEDLENKPQIPDVSEFIDNTVDDLFNYYLKNETYSREEVKTVINNRINELVDGAPETFDTLKEIADYIAEHEEIARALNEAIGNKVDKEIGKSLISNAEIERLAGVENYDDTEIKKKIDTLEENTQNTPNEQMIVLKNQIPIRRSGRREYYIDR